jgi:dihydroflavonol-4-reductase
VTSMATVLVTGGTGFIGQHLLRTLLARGDRVRCLVRGTRSLPPGVEPVFGDVTQPQSLPEALQGAEVVYHLAGATTVSHPLEYRRANAWGTRHLASACATMARPPRIIYLSSLAAGGPSVGDRPRDESDPPAPVSRYGWSKFAGEQALRAVAHRMLTTVVRGAAVFGPGDRNTVYLFKAAQMGLCGIPGSPNARLAWIYVEDMVRVLVAAESRGAPLDVEDPTRGVYNAALADQPTLFEAGQLAAAAVGRDALRTVAVPWLVCWGWGQMIDVWVSVTRMKRLLTADKMRDVLAGSWICRTDKAVRELGFHCEVSLADGFERSVAWYRQQGWL